VIRGWVGPAVWTVLMFTSFDALLSAIPQAGRVRLTHDPAWDYHPSFSPDGTRVLFTSRRGGEPALWIVPASGGEASPLAVDGSGDFYSSWAPDGGSIVLDLRVQDGPPDLYRFWLGSHNLERLTEFPGLDAHPSLSPDGTEILFTSMRGGSMDIWLMHADGSAAHPVLQDEADDWHPSWSPDGSRVVFTSNREGEAHVWVMSRDGSSLTRVTPGPGAADRASWSPDGSLILFEEDGDLWVVSANGGEPVNLTNTPEREGGGAWSPDGTQIVFSAWEGSGSNLWVFSPDPELLETARCGTPLNGPLPGYNASPKDPNLLFEDLAGHHGGVMAIPNKRAYSPNLDHEAMGTGARDLELAQGRARTLRLVDPEGMAAAGGSWGGMSNEFFASRNAHLDALMTFDGTMTSPEDVGRRDP
jgi:Tol biopolymer transport system component